MTNHGIYNFLELIRISFIDCNIVLIYVELEVLLIVYTLNNLFKTILFSY